MQSKLDQKNLETNSFNIAKENLKTLERELNSTLDEINNQKQENSRLLGEIHLLKKKLNSIEEKYSGENNLENLYDKINNLRDNNSSLKNELSKLSSHLDNQENHKNLIFQEFDEFCNKQNEEILKIIEWIETYMSGEIKGEIPELPKSFFKSKFNLNIDDIKKVLYNCRKRVVNEISRVEEKYLKETNTLNQVFDEKSRLQQELNNLKKNNLELEQEIYKQKEIYNKYLKETKDKESFEFSDKKSKLNDDQINEMKRFIEKVYYNLDEVFTLLKIPKYNLLENQINNKVMEMFDILLKNSPNYYEAMLTNKLIIEENNILKNDLIKIKKEYSSLKNMSGEEFNNALSNYENLNKTHSKKIDTLENQVISLKNLLNDKDHEISSLINDIKSLKQSNLNTHHSINEYDDQKNSKLEKKIQNLTKEIELKNIQIQSQEQMLNRRNIEIIELKEKSVLSANDCSNLKYSELERDKANLIKDNVSLINSNQEMKKVIAQLKLEVQELNNKLYSK